MSNPELEVKLEVGTDVLRRLPGKAALKELTLGKPASRRLRSIYYDTADHRLQKAKASLRLRWDGKAWIQTLKCGTGLKNGLSNPVEIEHPVDRQQLDLTKISDPKIIPWLKDLVSGQTLEPVFETQIDRDTLLLNCDGIGTAELALDNGKVETTGRSQDFSEVELELMSGLPHTLLSISEKIFDGERIDPSTSSKAGRGYALCEPCTSGSDKGPYLPEKPALDPDMTARNAMSAIGRSASQQILGNWGRISISDDPEVPHQLRVGLRRLRTCLNFFKPLAYGPDLKALSHAAQHLGKVVGELRNADVIIDDIVLPAVDQLGRNNKHDALIRYLEENRIEQRNAVRTALASEQWTLLKLNCMLFDQAVERACHGSDQSLQDMKLGTIAGVALRKRWKHVKRKGRGFSKHRIDDRHNMRKSLKTLRYACDYLMPIYSGPEPKVFYKKLRSLQDVFGYLNDVAMADELAAKIAAEFPAGHDLNKSVTHICRWHTIRARLELRKAGRRWRHLKSSPKFWH
ncbi:CYTH and CHAD domain-containing protein [Hoeflea prorocentri]|uniref:CHAD domain-containing protein n=1 Tax=Hoeflea prorocentri TaxID=1922333 RepID=A0A9X3UF40_9HYPH|nr:CYTH and CHAD domain-containing protein [Hoeflea prorocentri]MCY6379464.1 CHAD domain-containing protein [Hoeflea prorocentri]MDA5397264.1 CHAD domain-containing protein [Hoeflea prorocentri]